MNLTDALKNTYILDKRDHAKAMEIRYKHMCVWNNFIAPKDSIQTTLQDQFDAHTDYLVTVQDEQVVAVTRLIHPNEQGFFLEQFVNPYPWLAVPEKTIELSEVICDPACRKNSSIIYAQILKMFEFVARYQYQTAISISTRPWHAVLGRLSFRSTGQSFMSGWQTEMTLFVCQVDNSSVNRIMSALPSRYRDETATWLEHI